MTRSALRRRNAIARRNSRQREERFISVAPRAMTEPPLLFSFRRCPYAMRARLALLVAGREVILEEVKLSAKPAALLAASPKATVPVLVLPDGRVIDESLDIMRWALEQADPEGWLGDVDDALIARFDGDFKHHLDRSKYPERHGSDSEAHYAAALAILRDVESGPPPTGFTAAAILPFIRQFAGIDSARFAVQPLPKVQQWLATFAASPLFAAAMLRLAPGQRAAFNRDAAGLSALAAAPESVLPPPAPRR
jgi:glutathione S-transferase